MPETPTPATEPPIRNPVAETPPPKPLPPLADSDPSLSESLSGVFGRALDPFLVPKNIIRHTVVTIDNLPRKKTAVQMWPVKPIGGEVLAKGEGEEMTLDAGNYARYEPVIKILQNTDTAQVATLYKQYYPLFQEAYVSLGYPRRLLQRSAGRGDRSSARDARRSGPDQAQAAERQFRVRRCRARSLSSGQKTLIRMGSANAAIVKDKLRELRKAIAKQEAASR